MQLIRITSVIILFFYSCITDACSQTSSGKAVRTFVGSTPCDSFIMSTLQIPAGSKCDFLRWNLALNTTNPKSDSFQIDVSYGESKPNTNGFIGGGKNITMKGMYIVSERIHDKVHQKLFQLKDTNFKTPIFLIQMDDNILHFADSESRLLLGNGAWGYVLNRIKNGYK